MSAASKTVLSGTKSGRDRIRDAVLRREHEDEFEPRIVAEVSAERLRENYLGIHRMHPHQGVIPMIKADAYGHGAAWVVSVLRSQPMLEGFGVATLEEGLEVRAAVGVKGRNLPVTVFSGCVPWSEQKGRYCEAHGLRPVIASDEDFDRFIRGGWARRLSYELKFNTGMNRLGLSMGRLQAVRDAIRRLPPEEKPAGILSHLATAENPSHPLTLRQFEAFRRVRAEMSAVAPGARFHLANSAAIWNSKHFSLDDLTDAVRPGISLYGVAPWADAPMKGIRQVLSLRASIVQIHELRPGEAVGYGATYRVQGSRRVAIVSAGYADGIHRVLGDRGRVTVSGSPERFLGVISMDLCAVSSPGSAKVGDRVELLGDGLSIWDQAKDAGTLPYELLTSVSPRVQRIHA